MKTLGSVLILLVLSLVIVPTTLGQSEDENPLVGTQWQLVSYGAPDNLTMVVTGNAVTLDFDTESEVIGTGGCNGFGGSYTIENDSLVFDQIVSTLMACEDGDIMQQEQTYLGALEAADRYQITKDQLTVWYEEGQFQLNFAAYGAYALQDSQWRLISHATADGEVPVVAESLVTLEFVGETQVAGLGGCNQYGGNYVVEDEIVVFAEIVSTLMACEDTEVLEQEQFILNALQTANRYDLTKSHLTIWYDGGDGQLNFVPYGAYALRTGEWRLVSFGPADEETPVVADSVVTLDFGREDQVAGLGGCNQFSTTYTVEADSISFSEVVSTRMACADNAVMEQEQAYFDALQSASRFEIAGDQLTVWYADGQLNFVLSATELLDADVENSDQ